ncbi:MAG: hypothetical protein QNK03_04400 [Myxococcota bacterium]|nr:hypothetical protein [Myxococcota bacterium]
MTDGRSGIGPASSFLMAIVASLPIVLGSAAEARHPDPAGSPTAAFDWTVPARYVADAGGIFQPASDDGPGPPVDPGTWTIELDGCDSVPGSEGGIVDHLWTIRQQSGRRLVKASSGADCRFAFDRLPSEGLYKVTLRVTDANGRADWITRWVVIQDWLIVGMGDSYSSGEGVPDLDATLIPSREAEWVDEECHRSGRSLQAKLAQVLEAADPRTSVTFVHVSCSGAKVTQGELGSQPKPNCEGVENCQPSGPPGDAGVVERGFQVEQVADQVGTREIDLLLNGIGGNDVLFVDIVASCALQEPCFVEAEQADPDPTLVALVQSALCEDLPPGPQLAACRAAAAATLERVIDNVFPESAAQLFRRTRDGIPDDACFASEDGGEASAGPCAGLVPGTETGDECKLLQCTALDDKYFLLKRAFARLLPGLDQRRIVTYGYPNFSERRDPDDPDALLLCGPDANTPGNPGINLPGASTEEWRWVRDSLLNDVPGNDADDDPFNDTGLNAVMKASSERFGWRYVDAIGSYGVHGYCAAADDDAWINHLLDVLAPPVGNGNGAAGIVHPAEPGLTAYCDVIANELLPDLYPWAVDLPELNCSDPDDPAARIDARPRKPKKTPKAEKIGRWGRQ